MSNYEIKTFPNGHVSLRDSRVGETMHSSIGPWEEANTLYIEQSKLRDQFQKETEEPLIVYDIGLGIGANALATIELFERQKSGRDLHLISFENDVTGLNYALQNRKFFSFLEKRESLLNLLLKHQTVKTTSKFGLHLQWDLQIGNFLNRVLITPCPELIYYDFYSPKTSPELWGYHCFDLLFQITRSRRIRELSTTLFTYSSSTAARSAMLLAGFFVGYGTLTAEKRETTIASTRLEDLNHPLGKEWLEHLKRSSKPLPEDLPLNDKEGAVQKITSRIQQFTTGQGNYKR